MNPPRVSVVIPTYNQADYLAEAVQSVLDQTLRDLEVIVINDASTDHTHDVMGQYDDHRVKYLVHEQNRYASAARNTGINVATGELLAFLDADDLMHQEKLQTHVAILEKDPEIGLTYNSRIKINESGLPISIEVAPNVVTLSDLITGYPFSPSDIVMRRDWALRVGLFDESFVFSGEDPDFQIRLALSGCKMVGLNKVLNYRRIHTERIYKNLMGAMNDQVRALQNGFVDPRCPPEVLALQEVSLAKIYLIGSNHAFFQNETSLGQNLIRKTIRFDPSFLNIEAAKLRDYFISSSIRDGGDHEASLRRVISQMPPELEWINQHTESAVARGYLLRGARDIMWDRLEDGRANFAQAAEMGVQVDQPYLTKLAAQILAYEAEFGQEAAQSVLINMAPLMKIVAGRFSVQRLKAYLSANRGFESYRDGQTDKACKQMLQAMINNPRNVANRGIWSVLFRSIIQRTKSNRVSEI